MGKTVFIAEKPSVAREFADALGISFARRDGYLEGNDTFITWCVGHLVGMSYPESYDEKYKRWQLSTIPFIPDVYRYEVLANAKKQFAIVKDLLTRSDVETIYVCTDSGREGEYIYRLVADMAGVRDKKQFRVWIDSQTKEEILRGIREAKPESAYDNLSAAAYLRAKEDYLIGINFSRAMTLKYAPSIKAHLGLERCVIAIGRVMTCVLGIVVQSEREIRAFQKTPFYRVFGSFGDPSFDAEWGVTDQSAYYQHPALYGEKGFREEAEALRFMEELKQHETALVKEVVRKKEKKNAPLLYNLAELQNDCTRFFKISPDQTLAAAQTLYEKKLTTYPRTDARVISTAVCKEIKKNLQGLRNIQALLPFVDTILAGDSVAKLSKTRYVNDKAITDHYAIIPTGQGLNALSSLDQTTRNVYELICRRFLSIFLPPALYSRTQIRLVVGEDKPEEFSCSVKTVVEEGFRSVLQYSFAKAKETAEKTEEEEDELSVSSEEVREFLSRLKKGMTLPIRRFFIKQGETTPPKRYNSGSMILAMENAGQLIEEEELREQIKGSGIGTSATRAEIIKKLVTNGYLSLNKKTQILTPTRLGEMIYDTVRSCIRSLLDPKLTASWEIGLTRVAEGTVTEKEYLQKLDDFVRKRTDYIKQTNYRNELLRQYRIIDGFYPSRSRKEEKGVKKNESAAISN
ncbi:MAG: type IA DNA topoisomerase [Lachnospiraceae bacterium]|nr:type IA DNA topoisomerase [Lachnospiraceae bacterium]